ncbi:MAG TPA: phytanoyl-CoA dioxygenase family protein [Candidatus Limnocylindria bacterium]|nr:phytanoyl-CoA dioxygenase family protein [Candidatus Limnocylindria bacterium]
MLSLSKHAPHRLAELLDRLIQGRNGTPYGDDGAVWVADTMLLRQLGVGLHETLQYVFSETPTLAQFERWVAERGSAAVPADSDDDDAPVLSAADLAFWDEHGYVVVHDAVAPEARRAAEEAIWAFLGAERDDPGTWYGGPQGHSIWVPLLHHPAIDANRRASRVRRAFAQLWGREDLWPTIDQVGFNPPERPGWPFPGPRLHWDASLEQPMPFDVQGILYLTDTAADQGAFTCVPGFHRRIASWLRDLPAAADPRAQDLDALGAVPIAGAAGDLIIWHTALPHGSSPNRAELPRIVQYVTHSPTTWEYRARWT